MATTDEIRRRVEEVDTARSAKRAAAAQQVGELAQRRATIVEQLDDIERQLGDVLVAASDVMDVDELATFTDVPAADLTRWLNGRKSTRTKRKRPPAAAPAAKSNATEGPSAARTPATGQPSMTLEPAVPRASAVDTSARVPATVT